MEEKNKFRTCKKCRFYSSVYVEYAITFQKQKIGICVQTKDIVQADDRCEQFLSRPQQTKAATLEHLDFGIRDIEVLENIFYDYKD